MTLKSGPNLGLLVNGAPSEAHYAELMRMWRGLDALVQANVKERVAALPTVGLADGDRYLLTAGANVNKIARYSTDLVPVGWEYYTPQTGWYVWIEADAARWRFSGSPTPSWAVDPSGGGGGSGDVVGPGSSLDSEVALFDGLTGKLIKGGGALGSAAFASEADLLDRTNHTGTQAISTVSGLADALDDKVDKVAGKGLSEEDFTTVLRTKLIGLEAPNFRGTFTSFGALVAGVTSPVPGNYADVDPGIGDPVVRYVWDDTDEEWQTGAGGGGPASTDALPEGLTNLYFTEGRVRSALLTGLSTATTTVITAADSILVALGKLAGRLETAFSRANHTGTQAISTVTGLQTALDDKQPLDADTAKLDVVQTWVAVQRFDAAVREKAVTVGASDIDLALGAVYSKTISGATTFTLSNVPATGTVPVFILRLTNGGSATVTWWSGIKWPGGTPPTLTASGLDAFGFYTVDGGTSWEMIGGDLS